MATGGLGTSAGLGDQASIAITADERFLLAVNGGSDDLSLLEITDWGLELADVAPVGDRPVSVAVHGNLAYVLNQGADTIQALRLTDESTLVSVPHSTNPLSTAGASASGLQRGRSPARRHREGKRRPTATHKPSRNCSAIDAPPYSTSAPSSATPNSER